MKIIFGLVVWVLVATLVVFNLVVGGMTGRWVDGAGGALLWLLVGGWALFPSVRGVWGVVRSRIRGGGGGLPESTRVRVRAQVRVLLHKAGVR